MSEAIIEIARIPVLQRHSLYPAVEVVGPAVVATGEFGGIAAPSHNHERAAMGALLVWMTRIAPAAPRTSTTGLRLIVVAK